MAGSTLAYQYPYPDQQNQKYTYQGFDTGGVPFLGGYSGQGNQQAIQYAIQNGIAPPPGMPGSGGSGGIQSMYYPGTSTNYMNQYPDALSGFGPFANIGGGYNSYPGDPNYYYGLPQTQPQQTQQQPAYQQGTGGQGSLDYYANMNRGSVQSAGGDYVTRNRTIYNPDGTAITVGPGGQVANTTVSQYGGIDPSQLGSMTLQQLQAAQGKINPNDPNAQNQWWQIQNEIVNQANQRNQTQQNTGGSGGGSGNWWDDFFNGIDLGGDIDLGDIFGGGSGGGGGGSGTGGGMSLTAAGTPQIPVGDFLTPRMIDQMLHGALAQNAQQYQSANQKNLDTMTGRGFSAGSGAIQSANQGNALIRAIADTQARTQIPIQAARENADYLLQAMMENAKQRGLDISTFTALLNAQTGILSPILGAVVGTI